MNLYFVTSLLFMGVAILSAIDAFFISFSLFPWFNGIRWLRVHLITLGVITESLFGLLPLLVSSKLGQPKPATRLDIWLTLNTGLLTLLIGIPIINKPVIIAGGSLIFIATTLLIRQLWQLGLPTVTPKLAEGLIGSKFYITGLGYFLLGIFIGTGLWLGWPQLLAMKVPIEVHIHANNWGLLSLVFAGLLVDLYPKFTGRSFAWPHSINLIFWGMTLGAFGLVLGPWTTLKIFTVPGLLMHLAATIWLLLNITIPLKGHRELWTPGILHIITAYVWILAPVAIAPLILLEVPGFPGVGIEANAPQALIYGWVLQFSYALLPYIFGRFLLGEKSARLGGNWFSLITVHLGGLCLWISIFILPYQNILHGTAYVLWTVSMLPIFAQLWTITTQGWQQLKPNQ